MEFPITLRDCTRGKVSLDANPGPDRLFSYEKEIQLIEHIKYAADIGYARIGHTCHSVTTLKMSDSDGEPCLSAHTLAALKEFYVEQEADEQKLQDAKEAGEVDIKIKEDWQLSQFWYDDESATRLAKAAIEAAGENGRIACISCPTSYKKIRELQPDTCRAKCLEYDRRFSVYKDDYCFYDYNNPVDFPEDWRGSFDVVLADPPFLSEECLCKTAVTVKYLAKNRIILCTGAVMEELASRLLKLKPCTFQPRHENGLQNEFMCFSNFDCEHLNAENT